MYSELHQDSPSEPVMPMSVIHAAFLVVTQHLKSFANFLKSTRIAPLLVRVKFLGHFTIGRTYIFGGRCS